MATKKIDLDEWYTNEEAVERLSKNSGRPIDRNYPRTLARYRKVKSLDISNHNKLYFKADIDQYVVGSTRGRKKALDDDTVKREAIRKEQEH